MIRKTFLLALTLISILVISSCKKDSAGNTIIPGINTSMSAKVGGVDWSTLVRVCNKSGNTITLTGTSIDGQIIEINISPNISSDSLAINKDYTIPITSFYKKQATTNTDDIYFSSPLSPSSVKLTQLDKTNKLISGTFSFTGVSMNFGMTVISSGTFNNISYIGN
jgi:hypothetical protein